MESNKKLTVRQMALVALMAAVTCTLSPFTIAIPISPVPISLANLAIFFSLYVLGAKWGTLSYLLYLLIGLAGLPVFSGFTGGPGKLFGPTGGYLIGFVFMALLSGFFIDTYYKKRALCFLGMLLGTLVCYFFGTVWLAWQNQMGFGAALTAGVLPFLPGDFAKILCATAIGPVIRKSLVKAGLATYGRTKETPG